MATHPSKTDLSETYHPSLYASAIITYTAATIAVMLRFYARHLTHLKLWYDDWLAVVAWLAVTGFFIDSLVWLRLGLGIHYQALPASYLTIVRNTLLNLWVEELFYSTATVFMKLSILAFYWRIFNVASIRWPIRVLAACVISWLVARCIAIILHCIPVAAYWDKSIKTATCGVNDRLFFIGTNTVNVVLDSIIFVLPMQYVKKLQVRRSQKLAVAGMFGLGSFIVAVSVVLLVVCYKLDNKSPDISWNISPIVLWAGTEINLGVVAACLPSLRPIVLLVRTGSAKPSQTKNSRKFDDTYALRNRAVATFGSMGRNAKNYSGTDVEEEDHPFTIIHDNDLDTPNKQHSGDVPITRNSNFGIKEVQPPADKVMVREDIYVKYSNV